jgi:dTDP-glucose pyrophosphorylase
MKMRTAVVLAAGAGTRMRRADTSSSLTPFQEAAADAGIKVMMPFERPFLDYILGALAEAEFERICLVISPQQTDLADHCRKLGTRRVQLELALQARPRGTADALLAAETVVGPEIEFAVLNGDTYYSVEALETLQGLAGVGLVAFDRAGLLASRRTNIDPQRVARFAIVQPDASGALLRILEKPDPTTYASLAEPVLVSLNCWRFSPRIFRACESIDESPRGELELTSAVQYCIDELGESFTIRVSSAPVFDLSERGDVARVGRFLEGREVLL